MDTAVAQRQAKAKLSRSPKWLVVRNLSDGHVSFSHPDLGIDVSVPPFSERALDYATWDDVPDIDKFVAMGLLSKGTAERRPAAVKVLPPEHQLTIAADRSAVEQIAFSNKEADGVSVAEMLIHAMPQLDTPNMAQRDKNLDIAYLKQRHIPILRAALWYLENWNLPWSDERAAVIRERIDFISGLS